MDNLTPCACGCGSLVGPDERGRSRRYIHGHNTAKSPRPKPTGICECGCGEPTPPAKSTNYGKGLIRGKPMRFVPGHSNALSPKLYKVDEETGCWNWLRTKANGYGQMRSPAGIWGPAHRVFYERVRGPIPEGLELDHLCCNRGCVNPDHLEAVTHAENVRRGRLTKLTKEQVREIRLAYTEGQGYAEIAKRYDCTRQNIYQIVQRKWWRDA